MVLLFVKSFGGCTTTACFSVQDDLTQFISSRFQIDSSRYYITNLGGVNCKVEDLSDCDTVVINLKVNGGIDFQHREGSKIGSGGMLSESQAAIERKERLRKLALESIDISKDPYIMKNNSGTFECKLCLTLHNNEGNYLAHTQGKRHQSNLARRAAMEAKNAPTKLAPVKVAPKSKSIKIGRPGYKVTKSRDLQTRQRALTFEIDYPDSEEGFQPRHRFMSAYEQKLEAPDKNYQYLLFACEPYETVAFKIPNVAIDKREGRFFSNWDAQNHKFVVQIYFLEAEDAAAELRKQQQSVPAPRPQQLNFI